MNLFIDCGAYTGDILKQVMVSEKCSEGEWKFIAIECNPLLSNVDYGPDVIVSRKAAWIFDGDIMLSVNSDNPKNRGSSIVEGKMTGGLDCKLAVECFDFSIWLGYIGNRYDKVIVKMNIEGAEYKVLQKCIDDKTINLIDELYIRWHWNKVGVSKEIHDDLIEELKRQKVKFYSKYDKLLTRKE